MGWPFDTPIAPNLDSDFITLSSSFADVSDSDIAGWLLGVSATNNDTVFQNFELADQSGRSIAKETIGPGKTFSLDWTFLPWSGGKLKWKGSNCTAKVWGYQ